MRSVLYRLRHLNTLSLVGDIVCGDLGDEAFLEEVCH